MLRTAVVLPVSPVTVKNEQFQDEINQVSPSFCEIFNQASAAEQYGLHDGQRFGAVRRCIKIAAHFHQTAD